MMGAIIDAFRQDHTKGKWGVACVVVFLATAIVFLLYLTYTLFTLTRAVTKDTVLTYPVPQTVESRVNGVDYDGPAIRLGDKVVVHATKCLDLEQGIVTLGVTTQLTIQPGGIIETGAIAASFRRPGCFDQTFKNILYPSVATKIEALLDKGEPYVVMQITGFESPVDTKYAPAEWYTEQFRVYPALNQ